MKAFLITIALAFASISCYSHARPSKPSAQRNEKKSKASPTPATSPTPEAGSSGNKVVEVIAIFALYWCPAIVAFALSHHNRVAIAMTNLLLGWTVIGWIIALIWAFTNPPEAAEGAEQ